MAWHSVLPNKPGCFRHSQKWKESKREQENECFSVCNVCPLEPADRLTVKNIQSDTETIGLDIYTAKEHKNYANKVRSGTYSCCPFLFLHFWFRMGICITFIFRRGDQEFCNTAHGVNCNTISSTSHMLCKDEVISKHEKHYNILKHMTDEMTVLNAEGQTDSTKLCLAVSKTNSRTTADGQCVW